MNNIASLIAVTALSMSTSVLAQDPEAGAAAPTEVASEDWHTFSSSASSIYLVEVTQIPPPGAAEVTVRMASVPAEGGADDLSHSVEQIAFQCATGQMKIGELVEYGADGTEAGRYEDGLPWEAIPPRSVMSYLKGFACDNVRSTIATHPSIKAFIEGGRK